MNVKSFALNQVGGAGVLGCQEDLGTDDEGVCGPRLVGGNGNEVVVMQVGGIDPGGVDEEAAVGQGGAGGFEVEAAVDGDGADRVAVAVADGGEGGDAGVRCRGGAADEERAAEAEDVAAFEGGGWVDGQDFAILRRGSARCRRLRRGARVPEGARGWRLRPG